MNETSIGKLTTDGPTPGDSMCHKRDSLCWALLLLSVGASLAVCPRDPGSRAAPRTPGDGGFKISISGDPARYVSQSVYVVSIRGPQPFRRFTLVVDSSPSDGSEASPQRVGSYQLFGDDPSTTFNPDCINTVSESRDNPKSEVQVMWTAPATSSGCVVLRAMVFVDEYHWYADDGQLSRTICELTELTQEPTAAEECCACDQAKYKFIFEGLWSNITHPKDFPFSLWLTHFSDVIGGSHGRNFTVWREGDIASNALRQLAEWGSVRAMEQELRLKSRGLKTLIKAAGLWYPNVNSNTSSSFRVDRSKHLLSLVSMFGPSPDWVVGVSGLDLCLPNCTWIPNKVIDLYPYDAGTDNGITYMSPNSPTMPQDPIQKITSMYPEDPRAPFYDPTGQNMLPLARLYVTLDHLIPRSCSDKTEDELLEKVTVSENSEDSNRKECGVTEYSPWSVCSVTCGKGLRVRTRSYVQPAVAQQANCDRQLVSREMCVAEAPLCPGDEEEVSPIDDELCAVSAWEPWSDCTATCGEGLRMRTRHFLKRMGSKKCPHVAVVEKEQCIEPPCTYEELPDPECPTTEWSEWSPCSARCGPGQRARSRILLVDSENKAKCAARRQLVQHHPCTGRVDCVIDMATAKGTVSVIILYLRWYQLFCCRLDSS
ncbi:Spondin-1 [Homalodisca vitripennis]|nr:Spondin-1 [Homalodisca vitripennis]